MIYASILAKSTHLHVVSQQSTKMQQIHGYRYTKKSSELFCDIARASSFLPILPTEVPLQKVSFPVETTIPWFNQGIIDYLGTETFEKESW